MSTNIADIDFWKRYQDYHLTYDSLQFTLDYSRMLFDEHYIDRLRPKCEAALKFALEEVEGGKIANPDEGRQVGHYWLRNSSIVPDEFAEYRELIDEDVVAAADFASEVHKGGYRGSTGEMFKYFLFIGIGGSALGPQLITDALASRVTRIVSCFFDNTDPEGIDRVLADIGKERLRQTLVVVTSKSGGTPETRNGMIEAKHAFEARNLKFQKHAVAITKKLRRTPNLNDPSEPYDEKEGSALYDTACDEGWAEIFSMHDWVGGRTSVTAMVGLVPAALQGIKINDFLAGAKEMDQLTRNAKVEQNAAILLALMWYWAGEQKGSGKKDMVILPYKDKLSLFANYLQQLVMESLGKELNLSTPPQVVNQGIAVYGNKGSTDQHAYVQQLRDGLNNFFATFIEVRQSRDGESELVDSTLEATSGDYLQGFLRGTRKALTENGRESITISVEKLDTFTMGGLIALFERAVTFYAHFININAYHQPGVEAGKKAAKAFLELMQQVRQQLKEAPDIHDPEVISQALGASAEDVHHILNHLRSNPR
ncbi:MAG: glucose-6-phosphate isomerase [Verrucomicrobiota bacterium]